MKLLKHFPISILLVCLGYVFSGNLYCISGALLAGWYIDTYHLYDFLLQSRKSKKLNTEFIRIREYFVKNDKIIMPLKSWDITGVFILIGLFSYQYLCIFFTAAIAHGTHLIQDQLVYRTRVLEHSMISQINHSFNYTNFCRATGG